MLAFAEAGASLVVGLELSSTAVQRAEEHAASLHLAPRLAERISYQQGALHQIRITKKSRLKKSVRSVSPMPSVSHSTPHLE